MRQIGGAFRKAWFSDAQQDYRSARNSPSSVTPLARCSVQKQKAWFLLLQVFIRNRAHSPLCEPKGFGKLGALNRAPENRNEVRFLGRGGAERACEHCLFRAMRERCRQRRRGGACKKCDFCARNLIIEKWLTLYCVTLSEPPGRNGGESNGSERVCVLVICSLCYLADCVRLSTHSAQIPRLRSG